MKKHTLLFALIILSFWSCNEASRELAGQKEAINHPLSLWHEGNVKSAILSFVDSVTNESSSKYLPEEERVAVFDMDGTILIEKPNYVLFDFVIRRMHEQIAKDSTLKEKQPYKAIYEQDWQYFETLDMYAEDGLYSVLLYATDGFTGEQYEQAVQDYFNTVEDKRFGVSYNRLVYSPVIQLISYLKENDFDVYIVSGSDPQFTRTFCKEAVGISENNVIGTTVLTRWEQTDTGSYFIRQHEFVKPINDEEGKPVNILNKIGKQPVIAVGNSTGDYHMLEHSKNAPYSLQMIVNHDDSVREYNYHAEKMKMLCQEKGWQEISMKSDFKVIFND